MSRSVTVRNLQRARRVNSRTLRTTIETLLDEVLCVENYEISIALLGHNAMTRLNEQFLYHAGSTDVITFPYSGESLPPLSKGEGRGEGEKTDCTLTGDIAVCVDEAVTQARQYRTSPKEELERYIVHGVLHLLGYDDRTSIQRRRMKKREDSLMADLQRLTKRPRR